MFKDNASAKFQPFVSKNSLVYFDYIGVQRKVNTESEISRIHSYIIKRIDKNYGEIMFGSASFREKGESDPLSNRKDHLIGIVKREQRVIYSDRDIRLMKMLLRIVSLDVIENQSPVIIGTRSFHTVWEHILKAVIAGSVDLNRKLPYPIYRGANGELYPAKRNSTDTA
ncbi:LlaJI family restriction endonuclease [Gammaproteobacteria bacterium]|nr:LlaJI family restriction endonuclease [Gammaproteobacteria bacterium]